MGPLFKIVHKGCGPGLMRLVPLQEETPNSLFPLMFSLRLCRVRHREKAAVCNPERPPSLGNQPRWHPTLGLPVFRTLKIFLLRHLFYAILLWRNQLTNTFALKPLSPHSWCPSPPPPVLITSPTLFNWLIVPTLEKFRHT